MKKIHLISFIIIVAFTSLACSEIERYGFYQKRLDYALNNLETQAKSFRDYGNEVFRKAYLQVSAGKKDEDWEEQNDYILDDKAGEWYYWKTKFVYMQDALDYMSENDKIYFIKIKEIVDSIETAEFKKVENILLEHHQKTWYRFKDSIMAYKKKLAKSFDKKHRRTIRQILKQSKNDTPLAQKKLQTIWENYRNDCAKMIIIMNRASTLINKSEKEAEFATPN